MKQSRLLVNAGATLVAIASQAAWADFLPFESRLGGLAYYDPNLNISLVADANINDLMDWSTAIAWADSLTIGGVSGWRLPNADVDGDGTVVDCFGGGVTGCADNEMGFLYWEEGITTVAPSPFTDVRSGVYWSSTESGSDTSRAWAFGFNMGNQATNSKTGTNYAWAVRKGDVGTVPVPAAIWLFSSGLLGLVKFARRKKTS